MNRPAYPMMMTPSKDRLRNYFQASLSRQKYLNQMRNQHMQNQRSREKIFRDRSGMKRQPTIVPPYEDDYGFPLVMGMKQMKSPRMTDNHRKSENLQQQIQSNQSLDFTFGSS